MPEETFNQPKFISREIQTPTFKIVVKLYEDDLDYRYDVTDNATGNTFHAFGNGDYFSCLKRWDDPEIATEDTFRAFVIEYTRAIGTRKDVFFTFNEYDLFTIKHLDPETTASYDKEGNLVSTPSYTISKFIRPEGGVFEDMGESEN